jgi:hypothetical protein
MQKLEEINNNDNYIILSRFEEGNLQERDCKARDFVTKNGDTN